jgi:hypothetical protein
MLRPPAGEDIFFGPYDDIHDPDTYLPVITESQYCAPCHQFSFWGTPIYESYNEWLNSPYAQAGVTCQACHMPPNGDNYFALPEQGGLWHPAEKIPSHLDLGLKDTAFMTGAVAMTLTAWVEDGAAWAEVTLTNVGAGHHVPTDHPGRHLLLTIAALDSAGLPLELIKGPVIPEWGGPQAGLPGMTFAKGLQDVVTGDYPVVSYWTPTRLLWDNRLPALGSAAASFIFGTPTTGGEITLTAQLLFRRTFQAEMDARGWNEPDILMSQAQMNLEIAPTWQVFLPQVEK